MTTADVVRVHVATSADVAAMAACRATDPSAGPADFRMTAYFVAPAYRRRGVATRLLQHLAEWFESNGVRKVCVCVDGDSPSAEPFYESLGAQPIKRLWRVWEDIGGLCR
jgi:GNAT superfamily N-acetyltransferase